MDIASRIKFFMNSMAVGSSLFADTCQIPRPTLSQILNGRNKKISDEIISKIHDAYPQLSILWLMFGEGEMVVDANIQISEPQTGSVIDFEMDHTTMDEHFIDDSQLPMPQSENAAEKKISPPASSDMAAEPHALPKKDTPGSVTHNPTSHTIQSPSTISLQHNQDKRIVNIMVFYDDNSFESFKPAKVDN